MDLDSRGNAVQESAEVTESSVQLQMYSTSSTAEATNFVLWSPMQTQDVLSVTSKSLSWSAIASF
jgi:hypothetical protein